MMVWILRPYVIFVLLSSFIFGESLLKITLNSGQEFQNCEFQKLSGDTLYISLKKENSTHADKKALSIQNINSIVVLYQSNVKKYLFSKMSPIEKRETLQNIFVEKNYPLSSMESNITEDDAGNIITLVVLSLLILSVVSIGIIILVGRMKKEGGKEIEEKIPGVKEMAKTIIFWSKRHRDKISKY